MDGFMLMLALAIAFLVKSLMVVIPVAVAGGVGWFLFKRSGMGRELKHRAETGADRDELVDALAGQVERLQQEMLELQERVDFAERLMADPDRVGRLGPNAG